MGWEGMDGYMSVILTYLYFLLDFTNKVLLTVMHEDGELFSICFFSAASRFPKFKESCEALNNFVTLIGLD